MKNILITGGSGYIGSILTEILLIKGFNVTVLDLFEHSTSSLSFASTCKSFDAYKVDVLDLEALTPFIANSDVIIPLAGLVGAPICAQHKTLAELLNYKQVKDICQIAPKETLVLYPNTNSGYGIMGKGENICTETSSLRPISVYGETKVRAERHVIQRKGISFRLATVFGCSYRMRTDLMVNDFVYRAHSDNCVVIFEGNFRRNFIHIRDVANAFVHAIENAESMSGEIYNLGLSSANLTKIELCEKIKSHFPNFVYLEEKISSDPDKRDYIVSNDKLEATGWYPEFTIDDGIEELKKFYKTWKPKLHSNI